MLKLLEAKDSDPLSTSWLLFALSNNDCCDVILERTCGWSLEYLRKTLETDKNILVIVPLVRLLANACAASDHLVAALLKEADFPSIVLQLLNFSYEPICKESFLLVANIVNNSNREIQVLLDGVNLRNVLERSVAHVSTLF